VTGGSEGIGLATAAVLLDRGARVSLLSRSSEKLAAASASLAPGWLWSPPT
jgi:NAD(P)-dependent dehydrogenase (short-subunit alcohol dehydrogenase family)